MALPLKPMPNNNGGWFKPEPVAKAVAILIEVHDFERQRPGTYGPKDSALCDVSVFTTEADLKNGTPAVTNGTRVEHTVLTRDLSSLVGAATIATLAKGVGKNGNQPPWLWREVTDAAVVAAVVAYAEKRDEALTALMDQSPPF